MWSKAALAAIPLGGSLSIYRRLSDRPIGIRSAGRVEHRNSSAASAQLGAANRNAIHE